MRLMLWVVLVGVLIRAGMVLFHPAPGGLKRLEPSMIADNLNAGRGFTFEQYGATYRAWKEPLYIVLLAALTRWAGVSHEVVVLLMQGLFGIGAAIGVMLIARRILDGPGQATLAGVIASANPFLVYYDTQVIHPLSLDVLLFVLTIWTILLAVDRRVGARHSVWAGVGMGLALWQRSTLLASGVLAWLVALLLSRRQERGLIIRRAAIWACVSAMIVGPWLIRNYQLFGRWLVTTDVAHIVWLGNNHSSNGTYSDAQGRRNIRFADPVFQAQLNGASELGQYDLFLRDARRFIHDHPGRFGALVLRRLWAFVWFSSNAGIEYTPWQNLLYRLSYASLLALGLWGLVWHWVKTDPDARRRTAMLFAAVAGLALVHGVTAINLKHRVPLELVLAVFAGHSLHGAVVALARHRFCRMGLL